MLDLSRAVAYHQDQFPPPPLDLNRLMPSLLAASASRFSRALEEAGLLKITAPGRGRKSTRYSFEPLLELVRV